MGWNGDGSGARGILALVVPLAVIALILTMLSGSGINVNFPIWVVVLPVVGLIAIRLFRWFRSPRRPGDAARPGAAGPIGQTAWSQQDTHADASVLPPYARDTTAGADAGSAADAAVPAQRPSVPDPSQRSGVNLPSSAQPLRDDLSPRPSAQDRLE